MEEAKGARPKTRSNIPPISEVMKKGREHKQEEEMKREEARREGGSSDSEDDPMFIANLSELALLMNKPSSVHGTGLIYDETCTKHSNLWELRHPERPERASRSFERCSDLGLVDRCTRIQSRYGTEDQVLLQHTQEMLSTLQSATTMDKDQLMALSKTYEDVFFNQSTYECALLGMGNTIEIMEQILKKNVRNGFAIVRPPGHHAMASEFCGFCFFNNVAIAAKHALDNLGLKRILIVDWDVHHGQGIQQLFYNDPRVLYFSIHRYEFGNYWPNLRESDYDCIGEGAGLGYNINVPINQTGMVDSDYLAILQQVLMPIAYEFDPDLVLVSSGFDAAIGCPEYDPDLVLVSSGYDAVVGDIKGEMRITPVAYAHFLHMLSGLADGRVCAVLEGGYCLKSLAEGVAMSVRSLLGDPCPPLKPTQEPCDSVTESILNVIKVLRPYWKCLKYQTDLQLDEMSPYPAVNETPPRAGVEFLTPETRPAEYELQYIYPYKVEEEYIQAEEKWVSVIDDLIRETCLTVPTHRTCVAYDKTMKAHRPINMQGHPEKPERISRIYDKHREWELLDRCLEIKSRLAEREELQLVHSSAYVDQMLETQEKTPLELIAMQNKLNSIYLCKETYTCASLATGSVLNIVDTVMSGQAQNGVAIVRPPGHHAECTKAMGFCFFNMVAIAAKYAQKKHGVKRVMILDWDIHHGNGTQHAFYEDPSVLYVSIHRYDNGFFFPTSVQGNHDYTGSAAGEGFNVNIPWNYGGKGDPEYMAAFQQIVMPIAYEFAPELVLVSAGFDAAIGDPLGGCEVTPVGYGQMTHMLSGLANGKVVLVLEGGYNLVSIANSMATCTSVLLGDPVPHFVPKDIKENAVQSICDTLDSVKHYWTSLKCRAALPVLERQQTETTEAESGVDRSGDIKATGDGTNLSDLFAYLQVSEAQPGETDSSVDPGSVLSQESIGSDSYRTGVTTGSKTEVDVQLEAPKGTEAIPEAEAPKGTEAIPEAEAPKGTETLSEQGVESSPKPALTAETSMADSAGGSGGAEGGSDPKTTGFSSSKELLHHLETQDGIQQMFAVEPLRWCPHLDQVAPLPDGGLDCSAPCQECQNVGENWVCLICYQVFCSRYVKEHMVIHGATAQHPVVLSYADLSVWCYQCDNYLDHEIIRPAKESAHLSKFGKKMGAS